MPRVLSWQKEFGRTSCKRSPRNQFSVSGGIEMNHRLSRAVMALGIAVSLWMTSIAAVAAPRQAQDRKPASTSQQKDKDKSAKTDQPSTTQPTSQKPLPTNEDPNMIGKRNINKGIW